MIENANDSAYPFSRGHARTILMLKDSIKIQTLYQQIINEKISVRKFSITKSASMIKLRK